jgi:hypothetical protein
MLFAKRLLLILTIAIVQSSMAADALKFRSIAEFGFLSVLSHKIQFSKSGTYFD